MTEKYTISASFNKYPYEKNILDQAVKASTLPENIHVIQQEDLDSATPPFIVISYAGDPMEARNAFKKGASDYILFYLPVQRLIQRLNS